MDSQYINDKESLLDEIISYLNDGIPVFPVAKNPDKNFSLIYRPEDATIDRKKITELWKRYPDSMIGMPTGYNIFIIDINIDNENYINGFFAFNAWCKDNGIPFKYGKDENNYEFYSIFDSDILAIKTPRGGIQLVFSEGASEIDTIFNFLPGVNIYSKNHFVILPPSKNHIGGLYSWIHRREYSEDMASEDFIHFINAIQKTISKKKESYISYHEESIQKVSIKKKWLIPEKIPRCGIGLIYGHKKTYKTNIVALNWGIKLALKKTNPKSTYTVDDLVVSESSVYYISLENNELFSMRITNFMKRYGIDTENFHFIQHRNPLHYISGISEESIMGLLSQNSFIIIDNIPKSLDININNTIEKWVYISKKLNSFIAFIVNSEDKDNLFINQLDKYDVVIKFESLKNKNSFTIEKINEKIVNEKHDFFLYEERDNKKIDIKNIIHKEDIKLNKEQNPEIEDKNSVKIDEKKEVKTDNKKDIKIQKEKNTKSINKSSKWMEYYNLLLEIFNKKSKEINNVKKAKLDDIKNEFYSICKKNNINYIPQIFHSTLNRIEKSYNISHDGEYIIMNIK